MSFPRSLAFALLLASLAAHAFAGSTWYVKPPAAAGGSTPGPGTSWQYPTTLDNALSVASAGDEIRIAEGVYLPTVNSVPGSIDPRDRSFLINKSLTLIGGWLGYETGNTPPQGCPVLTVLDGNLDTAQDCDNSFHVVSIIGGPGSKIALSRVKIINGKAKASATPCNSVLLSGVLDPRNCGAGIYIKSRSTVSLSELVLQENSCIGLGGALYANGCSLSITQTIMRTNVAYDTTDGGGGAMYLNCPVARVANAVILGNGNNTARGGGVYAAGGDMEFANCVFSENRAQGPGSGGAMYLEGDVYARFFNCTLGNNYASAAGVESIDMSTLTGECLLFNTIVYTPAMTIPHFAVPSAQGQFQSASCYLQILPGQSGPSADISAVGYPTRYYPMVGISYEPNGLSLAAPPATSTDVTTRADPARVPADTLDLDHDGNSVEPLPVDREYGLRFAAGGTVSMGAYQVPYSGLSYYVAPTCNP